MAPESRITSNDPTRRVATRYDRRRARQIRIHWLINLRWLAVLGQLVTMLIVQIALGIDLPWSYLGAVLLIEVGTNLVLDLWTRYRHHHGKPYLNHTNAARIQLGVMLLDTVLLFVLLYLTGGVENPFAAFLTVHIVMAAVLLPPRLAWFGAAFAFACLWGLWARHEDLPGLADSPTLREVGRVLALGTTMAITVYFVTRITRALDQRSRELEGERDRQVRSERIEALGTLAAGAAHELATPLSTIAVIAKELELRLVRENAPAEDVEDAQLLRQEVGRCRRILDRMSSDSGDRAGESLVRITVGELIDETLREFPGQDRVRVTVGSAHDIRVRVPREALAMALRNLLSNAIDASRAGESVRLEAATDGRISFELAVHDDGEGMDAEHLRRASDPFFTTKEPGEGMGLGLFLSHSVVERLGGDLVLDSAPGRGTTVRLVLPLDHPGPQPT